MSKSTVFYLPEGFADWEGAFIMPELREAHMPMKIVSENGSPVKSIGGLKVEVECPLKDVQMEDTAALVLIGSETWMDATKNRPVLELAEKFHKAGIMVAGICGATTALARIGMLEDKKHTSNDLEFLKHFVPNYKGEKHYVDALCVRDGNLITAPGVAPLEFTLELMKFLGIYTETKRGQWFALYKNGVKPPMDFWS